MRGAIAAIAIVTFIELTASGQTPAVVGEECRQAAQVLRLARIYGSADLALITTKKEEVCAMANVPNTIYWQGRRGEPLKSGNAWYYPSGKPAKSGSAWYYPNHEYLRTGGTWFYPDGNPAKSGNTWTRPDRSPAALAALKAWACERVDAARCAELLSEIRSATEEDDRIIATIELAWLAR